MPKTPQKDTSWENSSQWYAGIVGEQGSYYHQQVILPALLPMLNSNTQSRILDLGCGQGILARALTEYELYQGYDLSSSLVGAARREVSKPRLRFDVDDCTSLKKEGRKGFFTHAVFLLSIQNMNNPKAAIASVAPYIQNHGALYLVLNHPCFRIPRQSSWTQDPDTRERVRQIRRYMSPMEIPIQTNPGKGSKSKITHSYHFPLSYYVQSLQESGFCLTDLQELISDKNSTTSGKTAKMENLARSEFPLFMIVRAQKIERKR